MHRLGRSDLFSSRPRRGSRRRPARPTPAHPRGSPGSRSRCARRRSGSRPRAFPRSRSTSCTDRAGRRHRSPSPMGRRPVVGPGATVESCLETVEPHPSAAGELAEVPAHLARRCWCMCLGRDQPAAARAPAEVGGDDARATRLAERALPGSEVRIVAVRVPVPSPVRLGPTVELHQHLGVRPHPELVDAAPPLRAQPGVAEVDPPQRRERQREHDAIGRRRPHRCRRTASRSSRRPA